MFSRTLKQHRIRWLVVAVSIITVPLGLSIMFVVLTVVLFEANYFGNGSSLLGPNVSIRDAVILSTVLLGAPLVLWRYMLANHRADMENRRALALGFAKAVDQLGAYQPDKQAHDLTTRRAAIYTLGEIARTSPDNCRGVLEILCGYVQTTAPVYENLREPLSLGSWRESPVLRSDVQAALTVIGRVTAAWPKPNPAPVAKRVTATLRNLIGKRARDQAGNYHHRSINKIATDLLKLDGCDLKGADFVGLDLRYLSLCDCDLRDARFSHANCENVNFLRSRLQRALFEKVFLSGADFTGADLKGAVFSGISVMNDNNVTDTCSGRYDGITFDSALLDGAAFRFVDLSSCVFFDAKTENAFGDETVTVLFRDDKDESGNALITANSAGAGTAGSRAYAKHPERPRAWQPKALDNETFFWRYIQWLRIGGVATPHPPDNFDRNSLGLREYESYIGWDGHLEKDSKHPLPMSKSS